MNRLHRNCVSTVVAAFAILTQTSNGFAQATVEELRLQKVGDVTYFHVRLREPADFLREERFPTRDIFGQPMISLGAKLIAESGLSVACPRQADARDELNLRRDQREEIKDLPGQKENEALPRDPVQVKGLEFVGRCTGKGKVEAKLIYPTPGRRLPLVGRFARTTPPTAWREVAVTLDFDAVKPTAIPREAVSRKKLNVPIAELWRYAPVADDLEGLWAVAQIDQFLDLDRHVNEFGFYQFAATALARKHHVNSFHAERGGRWNNFTRSRVDDPGDLHELYEMTTGAAAIAESLQLRRMNAPRGEFDDVKRVTPIAEVRGIDIAEHPWKKMMGDKTPAPEPMAKLTPHDNYYVHFKTFAGFQEISELLDQWGTNVLRAYQVNSRDYRVKQRYEEQLCLKSTLLGKTLGPLVINGVAITGSDPFLREGSDIALLFNVKSKTLFLAAVEPFLAEARKKHGGDLKEERVTYKEISIERFTTPRRDVSLNRATLGDVVIYANSLVGLQRIIDAHQGARKPLADSLDFQYMRTIFRHDDAGEDGFVFLSDAFIRTLVGPATKIKERRRLEALASLHMLTHGALFAAWEHGKPAESLQSLLSQSTLQPDEVPMPEGKPATWDPFKTLAHSEVYNTIHFATPLIELPIDRVTRREAEEYERFRLEYSGLWRQFFDPIGIRVALKPAEVKVETYILPLVENSAYNRLRTTTGNGTTPLAPAAIPKQTLVQYLQHINADELMRGGFGVRNDGYLTALLAAFGNPLGKWVFVRLDDSPAIDRFAKALDKFNEGEPIDDEVFRQAWQLPIVVGADIRNPVSLTAALTALRTSAMKALPGGVTWEPLDDKYKDVAIVRIGAPRAGEMLGVPSKRKERFEPTLYYAMIDGAFYLTLNEPTMKSVIDTLALQKSGKLPTVDVNTSLYVSPAAAIETQPLVQRLLERQVHRQALSSAPIWYALYRTNIVAKDTPPPEADELAHRFLGFVPVSPEAAPFRFDPAHDEVTNDRHGSARKPKTAPQLAPDSPLARLLDQLRTVRADLRFREDGIHTTVTIERGKKGEAK